MTRLRQAWTASILLAWSAGAVAQIYYVDSAIGSDSASGTSQSTPWHSTAKVSSAALQPGDQVLFRRGQSFGGIVDVGDSGTAEQPITLGSWGSGGRPVLFQMKLRGSFTVVEELIIDQRKQSADALVIRGARNVVLRDLELRNGTRDAIDADSADNLLIESVHIHHFLAGSLGSGDDAHGVVVTSSDGVTIRGADIHHVSGDSFQADPNRTPGAITNNIVIESSHLWTGPLAADFNSGWRSGDLPGENAVDTKVLTSGFESEPRMQIRLTDIVAHGWSAAPGMTNRAAFNLKEKINATLNRITVYDSEIAFRVRGGRGNADTRITNAVVFDTQTAIRAEDGLSNLRVYNSTFGNGIGTVLRQAGSAAAVGTWDLRNNAFLQGRPSEAFDNSNRDASSGDFVSIAQDDYQLSASSSLIDQGAPIPTVMADREGRSRDQNLDVGAYEWRRGDIPAPPRIIE